LDAFRVVRLAKLKPILQPSQACLRTRILRDLHFARYFRIWGRICINENLQSQLFCVVKYDDFQRLVELLALQSEPDIFLRYIEPITAKSYSSPVYQAAEVASFLSAARKFREKFVFVRKNIARIVH
jgi:hypothetical protein